jgi:hypothetical protein
VVIFWLSEELGGPLPRCGGSPGHDDSFHRDAL